MILSDGCCYDCVTESDQCAAAARRCIQLLLPGTQGCFTETLRLQLELWNFRYLLIYINAVLILSLRRSWAFSEDLSIIGSFPTVQCTPFRYIILFIMEIPAFRLSWSHCRTHYNPHQCSHFWMTNVQVYFPLFTITFYPSSPHIF